MVTVSAPGTPIAGCHPAMLIGLLIAACTPSGLPPESPKGAPATPAPLAPVIVAPAPPPEGADGPAPIAAPAALDGGMDAQNPPVSPQP